MIINKMANCVDHAEMAHYDYDIMHCIGICTDLQG